MSFARAVAALALAGASAAGGTASADETCHRPGPHRYPYVCRDPEYRACVAYGSLGEEAMFAVGNGCPWPYGNG